MFYLLFFRIIFHSHLLLSYILLFLIFFQRLSLLVFHPSYLLSLHIFLFSASSSLHLSSIFHHLSSSSSFNLPSLASSFSLPLLIKSPDWPFTPPCWDVIGGCRGVILASSPPIGPFNYLFMDRGFLLASYPCLVSFSRPQIGPDSLSHFVVFCIYFL